MPDFTINWPGGHEESSRDFNQITARAETLMDVGFDIWKDDSLYISAVKEAAGLKIDRYLSTVYNDYGAGNQGRFSYCHIANITRRPDGLWLGRYQGWYVIAESLWDRNWLRIFP